MNDNILLEDWLVVKLEPAAIFRPTSLNDAGMGFALSKKVADLSDALALPKATFRAWLLTLDSDVSAIFLHGAEILSDDVSPLSALVVLRDRYGIPDMERGINPVPLLRMDIKRWNGLFDKIVLESAGDLRSYLSGELCVLVKPEDFREKVQRVNETASVIFENDPLGDLASAISLSIGKRMNRPKLEGNGFEMDLERMHRSQLIDNHFERIAIREMENRRVVKPAREMLLPKVKAAFLK